MRAIAEFIMRSRFHALLVAIPATMAGVFFWLSAAVVALVTLRKGVGAGAGVFAFVLLPAVAIAYAADPIALICIVLTFAMAAALRITVNWRSSLLAGVTLALICGAALNWLFDDYLLQLIKLVQQQLGELEKNWQQTRRVEDAALLTGLIERTSGDGARTYFSGVFCTMALGIAMLMVTLARYWQALLYNPGGFGEEFRSLRITLPLVCVLLAATMLFSTMQGYKIWAVMTVLPLFMAGVALVHFVAFEQKWAKSWMILLYVSLVLFWPLLYLACALGAADGFLNFRVRYSSRS